MQLSERQQQTSKDILRVTGPISNKFGLQTKREDDASNNLKVNTFEMYEHHHQCQNDVVSSLLEEVDAQKKKLDSIFNITERNEESEITGGTNSLLSNMLKAENEEQLQSRSDLNRHSLLSGNLNFSNFHQ